MKIYLSLLMIYLLLEVFNNINKIYAYIYIEVFFFFFLLFPLNINKVIIYQTTF